jgi:hypothetical protein
LYLKSGKPPNSGAPSVEPAGQSVAAAPQNVFESVRVM